VPVSGDIDWVKTGISEAKILSHPPDKAQTASLSHKTSLSSPKLKSQGPELAHSSSTCAFLLPSPKPLPL